jgi:hypothetical protein
MTVQPTTYQPSKLAGDAPSESGRRQVCVEFDACLCSAAASRMMSAPPVSHQTRCSQCLQLSGQRRSCRSLPTAADLMVELQKSLEDPNPNPQPSRNLSPNRNPSKQCPRWHCCASIHT